MVSCLVLLGHWHPHFASFWLVISHSSSFYSFSSTVSLYLIMCFFFCCKTSSHLACYKLRVSVFSLFWSPMRWLTWFLLGVPCIPPHCLLQGMQSVRACSILLPSLSMRILSPPLEFFFYENSSTCIVHVPLEFSLPWGVSSIMKFARAWSLMAFAGTNFMSNSLSSIVHFFNLPDMSGFCSTYSTSCSIGRVIVWAWKYGCSLRAAKMTASAIFSMGGYLSSTPCRAYDR